MRRLGFVVGALFVAACSGSSGNGTGGAGGAGGAGTGGGGGTGTEVICVTTSPNGTEGCTILEDLSPAGVTSATNNCQGTVENACPSGMIGCCSIAAAGPGSVPQEVCYYAGTASTLQTTCTGTLKGTWSTTP